MKKDRVVTKWREREGKGNEKGSVVKFRRLHLRNEELGVLGMSISLIRA